MVPANGYGRLGINNAPSVSQFAHTFFCCCFLVGEKKAQRPTENGFLQDKKATDGEETGFVEQKTFLNADSPFINVKKTPPKVETEVDRLSPQMVMVDLASTTVYIHRYSFAACLFSLH